MVLEPEAYTQKYPSVTIAIPAYNEEDYIEKTIQGFLNTNYTELVEILVADGNSSDRTQELVKKMSLWDERVKLLINPYKIQSHALNLIIAEAKGDVVLRADAHSEYAPDYIEKCVQALLKTKADNVGGAQRFVAKDTFQAGVAIASNSILGSGGAKYRDINYDGYADTVYIGCFWRKALLEAGIPSNNSDLYTIEVFDPSQITNQDAELNQKLLDKNPEAIYISSDIKVWYYPRKTWKALWLQYFKYGRGRYLTTIKHPERSQLRGKLPFLLVSTMIVLLCFDLFLSSANLYIKELFILGFVTAFIESLRVNIKLKSQFLIDIWRGSPESVPSFLSRWLNCGIVLITMPLAHFSGYGYQLFRNRILRVSGW